MKKLKGLFIALLLAIAGQSAFAYNLSVYLQFPEGWHISADQKSQLKDLLIDECSVSQAFAAEVIQMAMENSIRSTLCKRLVLYQKDSQVCRALSSKIDTIFNGEQYSHAADISEVGQMSDFMDQVAALREEVNTVTLRKNLRSLTFSSEIETVEPGKTTVLIKIKSDNGYCFDTSRARDKLTLSGGGVYTYTKASTPTSTIDGESVYKVFITNNLTRISYPAPLEFTAEMGDEHNRNYQVKGTYRYTVPVGALKPGNGQTQPPDPTPTPTDPTLVVPRSGRGWFKFPTSINEKNGNLTVFSAKDSVLWLYVINNSTSTTPLNGNDVNIRNITNNCVSESNINVASETFDGVKYLRIGIPINGGGGFDLFINEFHINEHDIYAGSQEANSFYESKHYDVKQEWLRKYHTIQPRSTWQITKLNNENFSYVIPIKITSNWVNNMEVEASSENLPGFKRYELDSANKTIKLYFEYPLPKNCGLNQFWGISPYSHKNFLYLSQRTTSIEIQANFYEDFVAHFKLPKLGQRGFDLAPTTTPTGALRISIQPKIDRGSHTLVQNNVKLLNANGAKLITTKTDLNVKAKNAEPLKAIVVEIDSSVLNSPRGVASFTIELRDGRNNVIGCENYSFSTKELKQAMTGSSSSAGQKDFTTKPKTGTSSTVLKK